MVHEEDHLRHDTVKLLGQAFALACLIDVKARSKTAEDQRIKENMELHKAMEHLQAKINQLSILYQEVEQLQAEKTQEALSLAKEKNKFSNEVKGLKKVVTRKGEDLAKAIDSFKQDAAQSYLVGFEAALEQAMVVHPTIDFSTLDPTKTVVNRKLVED